MALSEQVRDLGPYELLLSVARLGSVGAAAREHGISQPSASSRIGHLERRLGMQLLERSTRGSRLTEHGALVADWARAVVDAAAALEAGLASLRGTAESRLAVAASMTVAEYLVPHWLALFRERAPQTSVALSTGNSEDVARAVLDGTAQLGFIESPDAGPGLAARVVGQDTLTVIAAPQHPWARRRSGITAAELAGTPLVSRESGSGTRRYLERALREHHGAELAPPLLELASTTAIKTAVAEGVAPAVLSSLAVAGELAAGTVAAVPVRGLDLRRRLRLVCRAGRTLTGPAAELAAVADAAARSRHRPVPRGGSHDVQRPRG